MASSSKPSTNGHHVQKSAPAPKSNRSTIVAIVLIIAYLLSQCGIPRCPGTTILPTVLFWSKTAMQLMGLMEGNNYPPNSQDFSYEPPKKNLVALPNEVDASGLSLEQVATEVKERGWPREPVVIRKAGQSLPQVFFSLLDYNVSKLEEVYGDTEINAFTHMAYDKSAISMPFTEYTKKMMSEKLYARAIPDQFNAVASNLDYNGIAKLLHMHASTVKLTKWMGRKYGSALLFVGSDHVWSGAHCDIGTSAFFQIQGRKRWVFYSPEQSFGLYPYGQYRNVAFSAGVDVFRPDLEKRPLFNQVKGYEVIVEPGDLLMFPSLWWHGVQNLDKLTVGVDIPAFDIPGSFRRNAILTMATILNPKLWYTSASAYITGGYLRDVFFTGYMAGEEDEELASLQKKK